MKNKHLNILAFGLPVLYWSYLLFTAQTEVKWDSLDYERLGQLIYHQGWTEYFRTGPNREPLYPFLVSLTMRIGDGLHISYLKVLGFVQFALLLLTQVSCFKLLQRLNIKPLVRALTVLYIGISPALVNCALSLYSEILIIALIPAAVIIFCTIFGHFQKYNVPQTIFSGTLLGITLTTLTFVKGIFEVAGPLILISSLLIIKSIFKNQHALKRYVLLLFAGLLVFYSALFAYKSTNKYFNNNFTLTDRGAWAFYGFAARRVEPMSQERLLAGLSFIPGEGSCRKFYSEDQCYFWSFYMSDTFSFNKLKELMAQGYAGEKLDKELMHLSVEKIKSAPVQYTILSVLEGFKAFFWETTKLGFVIYPDWLMNLYDVEIFKNFLRLAWAILSLAGFVYGGFALISKGRNKLAPEQLITLFVVFSTVLSYTAVYAFFQLGPRYSVPNATLFLCLIAWLVSQTVKRPR